MSLAQMELARRRHAPDGLGGVSILFEGHRFRYRRLYAEWDAGEESSISTANLLTDNTTSIKHLSRYQDAFRAFLVSLTTSNLPESAAIPLQIRLRWSFRPG